MLYNYKEKFFGLLCKVTKKNKNFMTNFTLFCFNADNCIDIVERYVLKCLIRAKTIVAIQFDPRHRRAFRHVFNYLIMQLFIL